MYGLVKYSIIIKSLPEIESFEFGPLVLKRVLFNLTIPRTVKRVQNFAFHFSHELYLPPQKTNRGGCRELHEMCRMSYACVCVPACLHFH